MVLRFWLGELCEGLPPQTYEVTREIAGTVPTNVVLPILVFGLTWTRESNPRPHECTNLTNRVISQCELVTIFFQAWEASRHIFSDSVWVGEIEKHLTKILSRPRVEPKTFGLLALHVTTELSPLKPLTLSVREPHLCLSKQVGSRPAAE